MSKEIAPSGGVRLPRFINPGDRAHVEEVYLQSEERQKWIDLMTEAVKLQQNQQKIWNDNVIKKINPTKFTSQDASNIQKALGIYIESGTNLVRLNEQVRNLNTVESTNIALVETICLHRPALNKYEDFDVIQEGSKGPRFESFWAKAKAIQLYWNGRIKAHKQNVQWFKLPEREKIRDILRKLNSDIIGTLEDGELREKDAEDTDMFEGSEERERDELGTVRIGTPSEDEDFWFGDEPEEEEDPEDWEGAENDEVHIEGESDGESSHATMPRMNPYIEGQSRYGGKEGCVSAYFEALRRGAKDKELRTILAESDKELETKYKTKLAIINRGILYDWYGFSLLPPNLQVTKTQDGNVVDDERFQDHKAKVDELRVLKGLPATFMDAIWWNLLEAGFAGKVGEGIDRGLIEAKKQAKIEAAPTPPKSILSSLFGKPKAQSGPPAENGVPSSLFGKPTAQSGPPAENGVPSSLFGKPKVQFKLSDTIPPAEGSPPSPLFVEIKPEDDGSEPSFENIPEDEDEDKDEEAQGVVMKPGPGRENGEHQVWMGAMAPLVIEKFGPTNSCIYRTTKAGDLPTLLDIKVTPELRSQQLGERKRDNGQYMYTRRDFYEVVNVAFEEDDEFREDIFWDLRSKRDRDAAFEKKGGRKTPRSKPAYVKLKWWIVDPKSKNAEGPKMFYKTWEARGVLKRLIGEKKAIQATLHVAEAANDRYEAWRAGRRQGLSRSPTEDPYFNDERANKHRTPSPGRTPSPSRNSRSQSARSRGSSSEAQSNGDNQLTIEVVRQEMGQLNAHIVNQMDQLNAHIFEGLKVEVDKLYLFVHRAVQKAQL